ncbi:MAG: DNA polymerase Y family protein [Gammaproteobacteria bacterium]|nr:DNA polymerase Y family protein [Gammaproteobacteria bacterium]
MADLFQAFGLRAADSGKRRLKLLHQVSAAQTTPATTLWMAVYLPRLALHAVVETEEAAVVIETQAGRSLIISTNQAAERLSITNGMMLSAALSLCNGLHIYERDSSTEYRLLNEVAAIAYSFSDSVSLYASDTIVLEICNSLKLFGGLDALQQGLQQSIEKLKLQTILSVAPTACAATWLALSGQTTARITDLRALKTVLRTLPISLITGKTKTTRQFQNCGIQTLGDYMRLPHKDVNRRFGLRPLRVLQQALGELPELLQYYHPPEPFSSEWHFDDPVATCGLIEKVVERLLQGLQQYLQIRCAAIQYVVLRLEHIDQSISNLRISSSHYQRNDAHLKQLFHERLQNYELKQPVISICLRADEIHVLPAANMELFAVHNNNQQDWQQLMDILQARLGQQIIRQLSTCDDPRPEYAYRFSNNAGAKLRHSGWPFWLLETPQPLDIRQFSKNLKPENGAERIEQGWWAGADIRRDYYCTQHAQGSARYWVFQDCRSGQWFLHGLFG